jgi:hypothetical protein
MNFREQGLSLEEIRELDMVNYLASLGHEPQKIKKNGVDYWYLSPLRNEGEASFKINRQMNRWYDHGMGKGGNLIDFGLLYFKCSFREFMDRFGTGFSLEQPTALPFINQGVCNEKAQKLIILKDGPLYAYPLVHYLHERRIPLSIAEQFCRQVSYQLDGRNYYGVGFKNNAGGFEIRNSYSKLSSSPKDITSIGKGSEEVHIFEGFMDFLSFKTIHQDDPMTKSDCLILNGASMFEKGRAAIANYASKRLWLDRDTTGLAYTQYALSLKEGYRDESGLYHKHKDLNDWLRNKRLAAKKHVKLKVR